MPVLPPVGAPPYALVSDVLNMVKARMNDRLDTLQPVGGKILGNTQPFIQQTVNTAWRKVQQILAERGYATVTEEILVREFPIVASQDPASQCWLGWDGCFDGANFYQQPALPTICTHPLKIWERWSNQNSEFSRDPMEKILDGLPMRTKTTAIRFWEWRGDQIYMPGSQMLEDLRIRFVKFLVDFFDVGNIPWFQQPVSIAGISEGLSWMICAELASARGDDPTAFMSRAEEGCMRVLNLDIRADQRVNIRRQPRSGRRAAGYWV